MRQSELMRLMEEAGRGHPTYRNAGSELEQLGDLLTMAIMLGFDKAAEVVRAAILERRPT